MYGLKQVWNFISVNRQGIFYIIFFLYLSVLSWMDIRRRQLCLRLLLSGFPASVVSGFFVSDLPAVLLIAGGAVGVLFLCVSRVTGEAFGYGDSILIVILGSFLGFWNIISLVTAAFLLAAVFSVWMMAVKGFTRKSAFPFVPFLTAAYLGGILTGGF